MKSTIYGFLLLFFAANTAFATEYEYRSLMANTLPGVKCETQEKAEVSAVKPYRVNRNAKKFCQTQGYGWHLDEIKAAGELVSNQCTGKKGLHRSHLKDVIVICRRIKPGSVGMLPGKG